MEHHLSRPSYTKHHHTSMFRIGMMNTSANPVWTSLAPTIRILTTFQQTTGRRPLPHVKSPTARRIDLSSFSSR